VRWFLIASLLAACSSSKPHDAGPSVATVQQQARETPPPPGAPAPTVVVGDAIVEVEVVATPARIERGLMYREHLPPDAGMLFFMTEEKVWPFWMRNTLIPLDMIFIGKDMTVAGVVENAEPRTESLRQVDAPSLYVLEVNGGWASAHHIMAGAKVRFEHLPK
jgi:uncharacterized membrane protein (UPF0127 family)